MQEFKKIFILALLLISLVGCSNNKSNKTTTSTTVKETEVSESLTCTRTGKDKEGYKTTETYLIKYGKLITNISFTSLMEVNKIDIDPFISMYQDLINRYNSIPGITSTISKSGDSAIKEVISVDYTKLDYSKIKDNLGQYYNSRAFYNLKNVTIDEFKNSNLNNYSCK